MCKARSFSGFRTGEKRDGQGADREADDAGDTEG